MFEVNHYWEGIDDEETSKCANISQYCSNIWVEQGKHQWDECKAQVDTYLDEFANLLASKEYLDEDVIEEVSNKRESSEDEEEYYDP